MSHSIALARTSKKRPVPLAQRSFLVKEVAATSQDLAALAGVGLAALDFAMRGGNAPEDWKAQQVGIIEQVKKPKSQLLLMPAAAVQRLVDAISAGGSCAAQK